jgi:hypothetical protein
MDITPLLSEAYNRGIDAAIAVIRATYPKEVAEPVIHKIEGLKQGDAMDLQKIADSLRAWGKYQKESNQHK